MKEYIDVQVLKQQDFQDYSREDVEYAIDHCPRAAVEQREEYSKLFSDMVIGMLSCGLQSNKPSKFEEAIDCLLALACCTTPQLSCCDCPKCKEGRDEDEVTPCDSWEDEDILEAVKFIKKMKGA